jgi:hypothetical protein
MSRRFSTVTRWSLPLFVIALASSGSSIAHATDSLGPPTPEQAVEPAQNAAAFSDTPRGSAMRGYAAKNRSRARTSLHISADCTLSGRVRSPRRSGRYLSGIAEPFCTYAGPGTRAVLRVRMERLVRDRWRVVRGSFSARSFDPPRMVSGMRSRVASQRCRPTVIPRRYRLTARLSVNRRSLVRASPESRTRLACPVIRE